MSFWVSLTNEAGVPLEVESHQEGGTYVVGGSPEADLNVTYNYSPHYYRHIDKDEGLRWLDKQKASDTIAQLEQAVNALKDDVSNDYWEATEGNARKALVILLGWAKQHPDGIWNVD